MPLPWKKSKSGRVSKLVSDLQQSPKHDESLVVEAGFSTSLNDLDSENHDRIKKPSSKRNNNHSHPSLSLQPRRSLPQELEPESVTEDSAASKIKERFLRGGGDSGLTVENINSTDEDDNIIDGKRGGGGCVLITVVVFKVFVVFVLTLSTKKLAVGITLSALALLFLELVVTRVFMLLNLCPDTHIRLDLLIRKLIGKKWKEKIEESSSTHGRRNKVDCSEEIRVAKSEKKVKWNDLLTKHIGEEKEVQTMRDVVFKNEKSKSSKLKSKIVKKIVPKKLRSYKKKKKMKIKKEEEEEEEEGSVTEVSSLSSEETVESEISEGDEISTNLPLRKSCEECGSKGDLTKATVLIMIVLAGLLCGKVLAIGLTLSWCLILRVVCCKSQTSL